MLIDNGSIVFESVPCWSCADQGVSTGWKLSYITCPRSYQPVAKLPGRICDHCGSKNRNDHGIIGTKIHACDTCNGLGTRVETAYDSMPAAVWQSLPFKVYRSNRAQTWNEAHLAFGCIYTVTDYGDHSRLTDLELIEKVRTKDSTGHQAVKVIEKATGQLADHIGIFTNDQGYSVIGVMIEANGKIRAI